MTANFESYILMINPNPWIKHSKKRQESVKTVYLLCKEMPIFYSFYGNMMKCYSFFDMEGLMTTYGICNGKKHK